MTDFPRARRNSAALIFLKVLLLALGIGALIGFSLDLLAPLAGVLGLIFYAGMIMAGMAVGLAASIWWWRNLDEAAQEAHKWAWFWGGSAGLAFCLSLLLAAFVRPDDVNLALQDVPAVRLVMASAAVMLVSQTLGYGVAWAVWWLRRR